MSVAQRPRLCPCPRTCEPIWNAMAFDTRIKDQEADMSQGYSGDCVGRMREPVEFTYGGAVHRNDINYCIFTPLKGIIRYQENEGDLWSGILLRQRALDVLRPLSCCHCGEDSRMSAHFLWIVDPEWLKEHPDHTPDEYNSAPRKMYCQYCAVYLGLIKPWPENFNIKGRAKYIQGSCWPSTIPVG